MTRLLLLVGMVLVTWLSLPQMGRPLQHFDELRTAERAREMVVTGNWLHAQDNFQPSFRKPPLHYWLTALSMSVVPDRSLAARVPAWLLSLGSLVLIYVIAGGGWTGLLAVALLASTELWRSMSLLAMPDTGQVFFLLLSLLAVQRLEAVTPENGRFWPLLAGLAAGLGALHKLPIAVPVLIAWLVTLRFSGHPRWQASHAVSSLVLALGLPLLWLGVVAMLHGDLLFAQITEEVGGKVRSSGHYTEGISPAYYLQRLLLDFHFALPLAAWAVLTQVRRCSPLIWRTAFGVLLVYLLVISLADVRFARYLLPVYPWVALLAAIGLLRLITDGKKPLRVTGLVALVLYFSLQLSQQVNPVPEYAGLTADDFALLERLGGQVRDGNGLHYLADTRTLLSAPPSAVLFYADLPDALAFTPRRAEDPLLLPLLESGTLLLVDRACTAPRIPMQAMDSSPSLVLLKVP